MDQRAIERATDGARGRSGSYRRRDGWFKRWIREQLKERWNVLAFDQGAIGGAMSGASDGSGSKRRSDWWC